SASNSSRLSTYIEAVPGDAKVLNPAVAHDFSSQKVIWRRVFEGLVDVDELLRPRPLVAESWVVGEDAFLAVIPGRKLPDGTRVSSDSLIAAIRRALDEGRLPELAGSVDACEVEPAT